jgi:phage tail tape measure protein, TP901 family
LAQKGQETTTKFKVDISEFKTEIKEAQRQIRLANSEFKAASSGMEDWGKSADGLSAKVKQLDSTLSAQKTVLSSLEKQYEAVAESQGENSQGAQELLIKINNQKAAINKTQAELSQYSSKLDEARNGVGEFAEGAQKAVSAFEKLESTINSQEEELSRLKKAYSDLVLTQGESSSEAKQLAGEIQTLAGKLDNNRQSFESAAGAAADLAGETKKAGDEAGNAEGGFTVLKGALANLVAEGINAAREAIGKFFTEFDQGYNSFQAQTGASTEEMAQFKEQMDNLYKGNYGDSMEDIADSMAKVAQNSKETDPTKIQELTKSAIVLRDTFDFDVNETMRAANMLIDQFGLTGEEAFNLIAQGAQNGLDKNGDMLDSINEYSVHYKQLGYNAEEFFNSLENGTAAGTFSVDKLGDAVKEFGIRIKDNSDSTNDALHYIGLAFVSQEEQITSANNDIKDYTTEIAKLKKEIAKETDQTILTQLNDDLKLAEASLENSQTALYNAQNGISDFKYDYSELATIMNNGGQAAKDATQEVVQALINMDNKVLQNQAGVALFGTMWEDLGAEGIAALMDINGAADKTAGTLAEIDSIKYQDIGSQIAEIGRTIEVDFLKPLAEKALPVIKDGLSFVKNNLPAILSLIAALGAAVGTMLIASKVTTFINAFKTGQGVIKAFQATFGLLNTTMLSNPIMLIVAAVAALVAGFITLWNTSEDFRNFWIGLWDGAKSAFMSAWEGIVNFFTVKIPQAFNSVINFVKNNWQSLLLLLVNPFAGAFKLLYDNFSGFRNTVDVFVQAILNFFRKLPENIGNIAKSAMNYVTNWGKQLYTFATTTIPQFILNVLQFFGQLPGKIWDLLVQAYNKVVAWGDNLIQKGKTAASDTVNNIISGFSGLPDRLKDAGRNALEGFWNGLKSVGENIKRWASDFFGGIIDSAKSVLRIASPSKALKELGKYTMEGYKEGMEGEGKAMLSKTKGIFRSVIDAGKAAIDIDSIFPKNLSGPTLAGGSLSGGQQTIINNNYTQNNTSPKALSRLDIYRQTKNLIYSVV